MNTHFLISYIHEQLLASAVAAAAAATATTGTTATGATGPTPTNTTTPDVKVGLPFFILLVSSYFSFRFVLPYR